MRLLKSIYVSLLRILAALARVTGLAGFLERRRDKGRGWHWMSSLFAIYDIDAMVSLDVPWWTYDAIEQVDAFLASRPVRVFEYGSGASTVWLARRAASVTSVEHDAPWYKAVTAKLPMIEGLCPTEVKLAEASGDAPAEALYLSEKANGSLANFTAYASAIDAEDGLFDLIVVDGRARPACLKHAIPKLAPDGIIVFDNSHRARYRQSINDCGLSETRLRGLVPTLPYPDQTSILRAEPAG